MSGKTCFVVQGFGKKTDYTDGRVLDLDASYAIIKESVEAAGVECIRADEIAHNGMIDVPMYEMLLQADLVIADLSTYNVNAAFELGVRYGLRPGATIIVAESEFKYPFDVGHITILSYKHLGEDIGAREAKRFSEALREAVRSALARQDTDSPVYTLLPDLQPPQRRAAPGVVAARFIMRVATTVDFQSDNAPQPPSAKALLEQALAAINPAAGEDSDFPRAVELLLEVRKQRKNDAFVVQQLALATYKSKRPSAEAALLEARRILQELKPATTNDPETLGLWGAVHKRLWDERSRPADLEEAIGSYGRGFHLKQDWYNGINLAFLLDVRAKQSLTAGEDDEALADAVLARRTRREVVRLATPLAEVEGDDPQHRFWVLATLWEAALGLGDTAAMARWESAVNALAVPQWMADTRRKQGRAPQELLADYDHLRSQ